MKVVYILPISWGGIPQYTAELANAVSKYGDVVVMKPKDSNDNFFSKDVEVMNVFEPIYLSKKMPIKIFFLKNIKSFFSFNNIRMISKIDPDIIHFPIPSPHASIFAYLHRLDKRYPTISTLHGVFESAIASPFKSGSFSTAIINSINEITNKLIQFDTIIVHTDENKNMLTKRGISAEKIVVIPHGAFSLFGKYCGSESEENCILSFGYIVKHKGIEHLIKAVPLIAQEITDIKVIIAGEGDFSNYSKYIEDETKFEIYNKYIPNEMVSGLFQRARLVVLPYTYHQGHSGVLTIAFSFGKPVIVTNVGDLPNLVEDGKEGLVVPPKNPEALAEAIIKLLKDDELRKQMGENAYKKAQELSWDNIAKRHMKVYEEVIETHNSER